MKIKESKIILNISKASLNELNVWIDQNAKLLIVSFLIMLSACMFAYFYLNGYGLKYNDARSHLDIGRRVVEGLKPGMAQLGSVWLPLPHALMIPTIWSDFMWHSGFAGALVSMVSYVVTGIVIFIFLRDLEVGLFGRFLGVSIFALNINILYLQSTAMTELLLIATMTLASYYLMLWAKSNKYEELVKSALFVMLSTLTRYDGWFLFLFSAFLIFTIILSKNIRKGGVLYLDNLIIESFQKILLFSTLAGFGIVLWFLWNQLIFKDPLFFIFGPYSAHSQQTQLLEAGELDTKYNLFLSTIFYIYALLYNSYIFTTFMGLFGFIVILFSKMKMEIKISLLALIAPLLFNIAALFFGHSVLFIQGLSGNTWFNVRYGVMLVPAIAVFSGYLVDKLKDLRWVMTGLLIFSTVFTFSSHDAVTIDDAKIGSSQKNVTEVSGWLSANASSRKGYILISAASHDAIIFSSGLPMKRFIHEGTGLYWELATESPDKWARWIVMRTYDNNDLTWKEVSTTPGFEKYDLVDSYPFASIYELKSHYLQDLNTEPILGKQK